MPRFDSVKQSSVLDWFVNEDVDVPPLVVANAHISQNIEAPSFPLIGVFEWQLCEVTDLSHLDVLECRRRNSFGEIIHVLGGPIRQPTSNVAAMHMAIEQLLDCISVVPIEIISPQIRLRIEDSDHH